MNIKLIRVACTLETTEFLTYSSLRKTEKNDIVHSLNVNVIHGTFSHTTLGASSLGRKTCYLNFQHSNKNHRVVLSSVCFFVYHTMSTVHLTFLRESSIAIIQTKAIAQSFRTVPEKGRFASHRTPDRLNFVTRLKTK